MCVCMDVYMWEMYIYVCTCMHVQLCACLCIYKCMYVCECMGRCVYVYVYIYICPNYLLILIFMGHLYKEPISSLYRAPL